MFFVKSKSKKLLMYMLDNILRIQLLKTKKEANKKSLFLVAS